MKIQKPNERLLADLCQDDSLIPVLSGIQSDFPDEPYSLQLLLEKFRSFCKENMSAQEALEMLERASVELISKDAPLWEYIAARFLSYDLDRRIDTEMDHLGIQSWYHDCP